MFEPRGGSLSNRCLSHGLFAGGRRRWQVNPALHMGFLQFASCHGASRHFGLTACQPVFHNLDFLHPQLRASSAEAFADLYWKEVRGSMSHNHETTRCADHPPLFILCVLPWARRTHFGALLCGDKVRSLACVFFFFSFFWF